MKTKNLLLLVVLAFLSNIVIAQKMTIDNVYNVTLRNSGAIKEASEVKGYYFFYISDKIDRKTNEYTLRITDANLKVLKDIKFQDSKDVMILESSFNGSELIFLFYNEELRTLDYHVYAADGTKKQMYTRQLTKRDKAYLEQMYRFSSGDTESNFKGLYPIEGLGFISNTTSREDKDYTFQLDFFSSKQKKQWSYIPTDGAKRFIGDFLGVANDVVYLTVLKYGSLFDQKPDVYLTGLSLQTGKLLFEKPTNAKMLIYPTSLVQNGSTAYVFGEYFDLNGNAIKDKPKGFAFWNIDATGKINTEKYVSWDKDIAKVTSTNSKGKIDDFGYMFLHNFVQADDGTLYAIGEGFKKVVSAFGAVSKIMGGGASLLKVKVTDMVVVAFDANLNVKALTVYEKNSSDVELPAGSEFIGAPGLGKLVKYYFNGFDYLSTQLSKDKSSFSVYYTDYVKEKDYKGTTFNSITYSDSKFTTDRINTKTSATSLTVLPAKIGQVLVLEYYKKDKKVEARFEKMN